MTANRKPRKGAGRFQWSFGSWFGAVAGSTAWMLVTAGFLVAHGQYWVASIPVGCFLATNVVAMVLWRRRDVLDPFVALITILTVVGLAVPTAWITVRYWGSPTALAQMSWPSAAFWNYVVFTLGPVAMLWSWLLERRSRNRSELGSGIDAT